MIFYGKPFELVKVQRKKQFGKRLGRPKLLRFDKDGILRVDDERIAERMKRRYKTGDLPPLRYEGKDITIEEMEKLKRTELFKIAEPLKINEYWKLTKDELVKKIKHIYLKEE
jgi:hypothetical protein